MATTERTFIDTNILIYAFDTDAGERHAMAQAVLSDLWANGTGLLSAQVLAEFYNVAIRKLSPRMSIKRARSVIAAYSEWCSMDTHPLIVMNASFLQETHKVSWWDAVIIEAASQSGAKYLLSEDLQHGRRFGELEVRNPFRSET
ncbi:PIN domain-containing protein [Nocardia sp. NPDC049149]|uniref:PIN domain-containing protein n=1 Tax=Nocardia sp. NPDC049149 TaxID=3364315 RepID=UPI0037123053